MDLGLTSRGDYAVRAAISLGRAFAGRRYWKIREVAAEMDIPLRYTHQILSLLVKAGLAEARAGKQGGYRLLRDPESISMLEVVEAAEGPLSSERCTLSGQPCSWETMCAVHPIWEEAARALRNTLRAQTLALVMQTDARVRARVRRRRSAPLGT